MCDLHEAAKTISARMNGTAATVQATARKTISLDAERFLRTALEGCGTSALQQRWHMQVAEPASQFAQASTA